MNLSPFTNSLNKTFDSVMAIPFGPDYAHMRKLLGEDFDKIIEGFKNHTGKSTLSKMSAIAADAGCSIDGKMLKFIDFRSDSERISNGLVNFKEGSLPSIKFTKIEYESFALLHEIGHAIDENNRYPILENGKNNEVNKYWLRENFADFFASLLLIKATGNDSIVKTRVLPLRALSTSFAYQTTGSISWAINFASKVNIAKYSELEIKKMATAEWNTNIHTKVISIHNEAQQNLAALKIIDHCIVKGSPEELLKSFDSEHHSSIVRYLTDFNQRFITNIAANIYSFHSPMKDLVKLQLILSQPLNELVGKAQREQKFDSQLELYFSKFPQCPISPKPTGQNLSMAV